MTSDDRVRADLAAGQQPRAVRPDDRGAPEQVDALVHRVLTFFTHKLDDRFGHRAVHLDGCARMRLGAFQHGQGLGVQRSGFLHKDRDVELQAVDEVGDHHVFCAQAGSFELLGPPPLGLLPTGLRRGASAVGGGQTSGSSSEG